MSAVEHNPALLPPGLAQVGRPATAPSATPAPGGPSFASVLGATQQTQPVKFSSHALQRVERRGIDLDANNTLARLESGVDRAASKGARDSVVFVDGTAFVVSVRNKTVITAVDSEHMKEHVFTNIDSAVIA
jgi:flagellar operon protein